MKALVYVLIIILVIVLAALLIYTSICCNLKYEALGGYPRDENSIPEADILYHGSVRIIDLEYLIPQATREFEDDNKYVFAISTKLYAMMFMCNKTASPNLWSLLNGKPMVIELFSGDYWSRFEKGRVGYIYAVSAKNFYKHSRSSFELEYVSEKPAKILSSERIQSIGDVLRPQILVLEYDAVTKYLKDVEIPAGAIGATPDPNSLYLCKGKDEWWFYPTIEQAISRALYGFGNALFYTINGLVYIVLREKYACEYTGSLEIQVIDNWRDYYGKLYTDESGRCFDKIPRLPNNDVYQCRPGSGIVSRNLTITSEKVAEYCKQFIHLTNLYSLAS